MPISLSLDGLLAAELATSLSSVLTSQYNPPVNCFSFNLLSNEDKQTYTNLFNVDSPLCGNLLYLPVLFLSHRVGFSEMREKAAYPITNAASVYTSVNYSVNPL